MSRLVPPQKILFAVSAVQIKINKCPASKKISGASRGKSKPLSLYSFEYSVEVKVLVARRFVMPGVS
jgi:hypothetical protein